MSFNVGLAAANAMQAKVEGSKRIFLLRTMDSLQIHKHSYLSWFGL